MVTTANREKVYSPAELAAKPTGTKPAMVTKVPAKIGDPTPWVVGPDGEPLRLAPGGFSQAAEEGNAVLVTRAVALASEIAAAGVSAVELYAGAGNLTIAGSLTGDGTGADATGVCLVSYEYEILPDAVKTA